MSSLPTELRWPEGAIESIPKALDELAAKKRTCVKIIDDFNIQSVKCKMDVLIKWDIEKKRLWAVTEDAVPHHVCSEEEKEKRATNTHHYTGIFSDSLLTNLLDVLYVMTEDKMAEKVILNRKKMALVTSFDGTLSVWGVHFTFASKNHFIAGTPIMDHEGNIVSLVTCKSGDDYVVASFDNFISGYVDSTKPTEIVTECNGLFYAGKSFVTREQLKEHVATLSHTDSCKESRMICLYGNSAKIAHVCECGLQLSLVYCGNYPNVPVSL